MKTSWIYALDFFLSKWFSFAKGNKHLPCVLLFFIFLYFFSTHVLKLPMMKFCRRFIYHVTHQMKPHCHMTKRKKNKISNVEEKNKFINEKRKYWNVRAGNHKNDFQNPCAWNAFQREQCIIIWGFHRCCWCYHTTLHENPITKITMNFHFQFLNLI